MKIFNLFKKSLCILQAAVITLTGSNEQKIISEIKLLLQYGTVPSMPFNEWCNNHVPDLIASEHMPIQQLGLFFEKITKGNSQKIDPFGVFSLFEKAIQQYDPLFRIKTLKKPVIIAKGTYWYYSAKKPATRSTISRSGRRRQHRHQ